MEIIDDNWSIYETFLFQSLLKDTYIFPEFCHLIYRMEEFIDTKKLLKVIEKIILNYSSKNYDFEISWCLHVCKIFNLKLGKESISLLNTTYNSINKILILDLIDRKLINKDLINLETWKEQVSSDSLLGDDWLFAYEISVKKWLLDDFSYIKSVNGKNYFEKMRKAEISFYDQNTFTYDDIEFYEDYF